MSTSLNVLPEQLQKVAYERNLSRWVADECPTCFYAIHYIFSGQDKSNVQHDAGCTCSDVEMLRARYMNSSWKEVADYINSQTDWEKIKQIKEFWNL